MTATLEEKAEEILVEGRLRVWEIGSKGIVATCRSSTGHGWYWLGFDARRREWRCTCPVLGKRLCSHLTALQLVVHEPAETKEEEHGEQGQTERETDAGLGSRVSDGAER